MISHSFFLSPSLLARLTDCHCHIVDCEKWVTETMSYNTSEIATTPPKNILPFSLRKVLSMSSEPKDFLPTQELQKKLPNHIIPCYGIHPWKTYKYKVNGEDPSDPQNFDPWLSEMESCLVANPKALVGEIGIDKQARIPGFPKGTKDLDFQWRCFDKQWDLAVKLQRPISMHCVKAVGAFIDFVKEKRSADHATVLLASWFPPRVMLHSYGGSADCVKLIVALNLPIYFSFSYVVNQRGHLVEDAIKQVPDDMLLVESDLADPYELDVALDQIVQLVCKVKGWEKEKAVEILEENMKSFLDFEQYYLF